MKLYFTNIQIGSPPKDYHVQFDTGSDLLWVNCVGCQKCPKKSDLGISLALYNPEASSSAKTINCDQEICISTFSAPNSDYRCGSQQSGELGGSSEQALDGILGFGQANPSMLSQLANAKKVKKVYKQVPQKRASETGQYLMALQRETGMGCNYGNDLVEGHARLTTRLSLNSIRNYFRDIQRNLEIWLARFIRDVEGILARDGVYLYWNLSDTDRVVDELEEILMAAGDTFWAAASDQLEISAERTGCEIISAEKEKAKACASHGNLAVGLT
ncbi:hypothetical protein L2E82_12081 [Cichorium intybus]|uniref:Uncharacterized protein n=1 Tax=Cichorium intybus TaxID=13427 RepID=A0ACB9GEK4_CICIN|nr:hypothetical protein L2E82_12081 [Cichorium intybus]